MKKILLLLTAFAVCFSAFAQTPKEIRQSDERVAKIQKLTPPALGFKPADRIFVKLTGFARNAARISGELKAVRANPDPAAVQALRIEIEEEKTSLEAWGNQLKESMNDPDSAFWKDMKTEQEKMSEEQKRQMESMSFGDAMKFVRYAIKVLVLTAKEIEYHEEAIATFE